MGARRAERPARRAWRRAIATITPFTVLLAGIAGTAVVVNREGNRRDNELHARLSLVATSAAEQVRNDVELPIQAATLAVSSVMAGPTIDRDSFSRVASGVMTNRSRLLEIVHVRDGAALESVTSLGAIPISVSTVISVIASASPSAPLSLRPLPTSQDGLTLPLFAAVVPIARPGPAPSPSSGDWAVAIFTTRKIADDLEVPSGVGVRISDASGNVADQRSPLKGHPHVGRSIMLFDRPWSMEAFAGAPFRSSVPDRRVLFASLGLAMTFVLTALVLALADGNHRWAAAAHDAMRSLAASEQRLRATIAAAPDLLLVVDADGIIRSASDRSIELLRTTPDRLVGTRISTVIPEWATVAGPDAKDGHEDDAVTAFRADGSLTVVTVAASPLRPNDATSPLVVIVRDVWQRELARADRALLSSIVTTTKDPVLALSAEGDITSANPGAEDFYGWDASDLVGENVDLLVPEEHQDAFHDALRRVVEGEVVEEFSEHRRRDGSVVGVAITLSPLGSQPGAATGASLIVHDVTAEMRTRSELSSYAADLERSNRDLEEFASIISHDLSEPLRVVGGYTGLLTHRYQEGATLDRRATGYLQEVTQGVERMRQLIEGLLEYSRLRADTHHAGPVDLSEVTRTAVANLGVAMAESGATVAVGPLPVVTGDPTQLVQLMQNLIANAIRFRHRERAPHVVVRADHDDDTGRWRVSVADNGIGIAEQHRDQIFSMFRRLHSSEEYAGMGVGLAVCRRVVDLHGGQLTVDSTVGEGSTFTFTLPAGDEASPVQDKQEAHA